MPPVQRGREGGGGRGVPPGRRVEKTGDEFAVNTQKTTHDRHRPTDPDADGARREAVRCAPPRPRQKPAHSRAIRLLETRGQERARRAASHSSMSTVLRENHL